MARQAMPADVTWIRRFLAPSITSIGVLEGCKQQSRRHIPLHTNVLQKPGMPSSLVFVPLGNSRESQRSKTAHWTTMAVLIEREEVAD